MKKTVLVLLALLSLIPFAQTMAAAAPVSGSTAQFLATLAAGPTQAPNDLPPAPSFMTGCTTTGECPMGQLCCFVCGNPPVYGGTCKACVTPIKGRCPLVV
jgi:hypothetical protein